MPEVSEQSIRELAQVFKLLSDETRLRILFYLALSENRELHVTDLCQRLGQSQPAVSHHLALLRVSGLIESRREGKHNFYSVRTDHFGELLLSPVLGRRRGAPQQEVQVPRLRPRLSRGLSRARPSVPSGLERGQPVLDRLSRVEARAEASRVADSRHRPAMQTHRFALTPGPLR